MEQYKIHPLYEVAVQLRAAVAPIVLIFDTVSL